MPDNQEDKQKEWENKWENQDWSPIWGITQIPKEIQEAVYSGWFPPEASILDIGCGSGEISAWLAAQNFTVLGIDFSPSAIERAKSKYPENHNKLEFKIVDVCHQSSLSRIFNVAIDRGCLHGILQPSIAGYMQNLASWLSPKGRFLLLFKIGGYQDEEPDEILFQKAIHYIKAAFAAMFDIVRVERAILAQNEVEQKSIFGIAVYMTRNELSPNISQNITSTDQENEKLEGKNSRQKPKMGNKPVTNILAVTADDVTDSLLSLQEGGKKLDRGLRDLINEKYQGNFQINVIQTPWINIDLSMHSFLANSDRILQEQEIDIIVLSIQPEFINTQNLSIEQYQSKLSQMIKLIKEKISAYIIFFNCSSIDPSDRIHNYYNRNDTLSLQIQKFNLALIKLSMQKGVSIIDVDYLVAELGGEQHISQVFCYSYTVHQLICQEFLRVIEDVGFFEQRPLLMQIGQKNSN